jgi:chromosome segregation ATPase
VSQDVKPISDEDRARAVGHAKLDLDQWKCGTDFLALQQTILEMDARLTAAEAELDQARHDAAHHRERLTRNEARLAEVERERDEARATKDMHKEREQSAVARAGRLRVALERVWTDSGYACKTIAINALAVDDGRVEPTGR